MEDPRSIQQDNTKIYLIGGGIASLAAAAFLIRDADIRAGVGSLFGTRA
jgi:oleate hydratase